MDFFFFFIGRKKNVPVDIKFHAFCVAERRHRSKLAGMRREEVEDQSWMVQAASLGSFMLSVRTMTMV
jgi:hypothetical protein